MALHRLRTHPEYVEGCFGCKASTIQVSDIHIREVAHRNESELTSYREARRQGVQPRSTQQSDITRAMRASEKLGRAVSA